MGIIYNAVLTVVCIRLAHLFNHNKKTRILTRNWIQKYLLIFKINVARGKKITPKPHLFFWYGACMNTYFCVLAIKVYSEKMTTQKAILFTSMHCSGHLNLSYVFSIVSEDVSAYSKYWSRYLDFFTSSTRMFYVKTRPSAQQHIAAQTDLHKQMIT